MSETHRPDRRLQRRLLLTAGMAWVGGLSFGCGSLGLTSAPRVPPITLPFPLHKAGARIETDIRIVEDRSYRFVLMFMFKTPEERKRISELVGGSYITTDLKGRPVRPGVTVPIHLTVRAIRNGKPDELLRDERYLTEGSEGFSANAYYRFFASIGLEPGLYRATAETLQDVPEFADVESNFHIYSRYL